MLSAASAEDGDYECPRCHYKSSKKSNYKNHLQRKITCPNTFSDEPQSNLLETINLRAGPCSCFCCRREFKNDQYFDLHKKSCSAITSKPAAARKGGGAQELEFEEMKRIMTEQGRRIRDMELIQTNIVNNNIVNNNIVNNNNNININIVVNNFGSEDRSYITKEIMQQCLDKMKISLLVESIYFHPDHPENHTIKLKSEKKKRVSLVRDGKWVEGDMSASIDSIVHRENTSLSNFFYENVWPDQSIDFNNKAWTHKKLITINDKNKEFFEQRREIQAKLKNSASDS